LCFNRPALYNDHYDGELEYPGDALGRDCMVAALLPEDPGYMRLYQNDGKRNEDWFSWNARVYAPIGGKITYLYINEVTNVPGVQNPSRASALLLEADDGTTVMLGHIQDPVVSQGDRVEEGQKIQRIKDQLHLPHFFPASAAFQRPHPGKREIQSFF